MAGDEDASSTDSDNDEVQSMITVAGAVESITLDIGRRMLKNIPTQVLNLQNLEYLYLEGNAIRLIPSELFETLSLLKWLDLRNNRLEELPASIGEHGCLKTLLLEGNQLKELPCELGFVKTLNGLNLQRNPLEFPPAKVLEGGVKEIQRYLRNAHAARDRCILSADIKLEDLHLSDSVHNTSDSDTDHHGYISSEEAGTRPSRKLELGSRQSLLSATSLDDLEFPRPTSVSLHRHMSYEEYRQLQYERFKRAGALGVSGKDKRKKKKRKKLKTPPAIDPIESQIAEEKRLAKLKELHQKHALIEQKRKDRQLLDDWRSETKEMQRKHYVRAIKNAQQDFTDPALKMPYDTDPNYMKVMSKEERIKHDIKMKHEAMKQRNDPETAQKMEQARAERDKQLMERIKKHRTEVQERKLHPLGNPREEMEAAKQDLKMASDLQREVNHRRMELEYRFRAFTGDSSPVL